MLYLYLLLSFGAALLFVERPLICLLVFFGGFVALLLLNALVLLISSLFVDKEKPNPKAFPFYRRLLTMSIGVLLGIGRVKVKLTGAELLPEGGFLLVGNHISDFDPITAMYALRKRGLTFVTKKENVDILVGGALIVGSGCISLDRADDRQGLAVIRQAAKRIQNGEAIGIYPEGTRSKTGALLPFRAGCFKAAQWAKAPLVVLQTEGSALVGKNFFRRKTGVTLTVKAVIPYEELAGPSTAAISQRVRSLLTKGQEANP